MEDYNVNIFVIRIPDGGEKKSIPEKLLKLLIAENFKIYKETSTYSYKDE